LKALPDSLKNADKKGPNDAERGQAAMAGGLKKFATRRDETSGAFRNHDIRLEPGYGDKFEQNDIAAADSFALARQAAV
jgi:hypothetical protein